MGSGNEPKDLTSVYIMGRLDALHNVQKQIDEIEAKWKEEVEELKQKIDELEVELKETKKESESHEAWAETYDSLRIRAENEQRRLEAELEKRPVVYCYRNKHGDLARHFGSWSLALWSTPEEQKPTDPELDWKIEVYTGSNNQERSKTYTGALGGLF